jgi:hypothetical protein
MNDQGSHPFGLCLAQSGEFAGPGAQWLVKVLIPRGEPRQLGPAANRSPYQARHRALDE